jgi:putative phosphoribosyl transferase
LKLWQMGLKLFSGTAEMFMTFETRQEAGVKLGLHLRGKGLAADLVLGLPRGGVVVAAEVARVLQRPLDALVVRKIGHPLHREFAVGAMAEHDVVLLDSAVVGPSPSVRERLEDVIRDETARLRDYSRKFHSVSRPPLQNAIVVLVDDGLATGSTMEAAVLSARKQGAARIVVAAPVASTHAVGRLQQVADKVEALWIDPEFEAVGRYYDVFPQTSDEEVVALLRSAEFAPHGLASS